MRVMFRDKTLRERYEGGIATLTADRAKSMRSKGLLNRSENSSRKWRANGRISSGRSRRGGMRM